MIKLEKQNTTLQTQYLAMNMYIWENFKKK